MILFGFPFCTTFDLVNVLTRPELELEPTKIEIGQTNNNIICNGM